ncbi:MAG: hypothetical protein FK731_12355, partial [Asgard group archaeon]|nr:hypothetical protein [Asgard group archaeon]
FNSNNDLFIFNVTDLTVAPNQVAQYEFNETGPNDIYVANDILYIEQGDGLVFVDVSNTSEPLYYTQYETTISMNDLIVIGNLTYVYDSWNYEIVKFEIGSPISTEKIGHTYGYSNDIYIDDSYVYVADENTLEILDVSTQSNPTLVAKYFDDGGSIFKVFVKDEKAYILEAGFGMKIIDISDPINPTQIGNISLLPYNFMDIYVDDEYAYISAGGDGLLIVDIYYPDYPQLSLVYDEIPVVLDVEKKDNYLYCASFDYFHILDVSNIYKPEPYSNWTRLNALYYDLTLTEDYAYVVSWEGIDIIDITDNANPVKIGQFFNYENPIMVYVDGQYIYLLDGNEGVVVYDATIITHPKKIGTWNNHGDSNAIVARNGYIYIAQGVNGTKILTTIPKLSVKAPFMGPFTFFVGLLLFSIITLFFRKKKRR